jgi:hypothetical protein
MQSRRFGVPCALISVFAAWLLGGNASAQIGGSCNVLCDAQADAVEFGQPPPQGNVFIIWSTKNGDGNSLCATCTPCRGQLVVDVYVGTGCAA